MYTGLLECVGNEASISALVLLLPVRQPAGVEFRVDKWPGRLDRTQHLPDSFHFMRPINAKIGGGKYIIDAAALHFFHRVWYVDGEEKRLVSHIFLCVK